MTIILFEDEQVALLDPVALGRPAFAISCGSYRLVDLVATLGHPLRATVRPHLRELVRLDFPAIEIGEDTLQGSVLLVNARLVPSVAVLRQLQTIIKAARPGIVRLGETTVAALLDLPSAQERAPGAATAHIDPAKLVGDALEADLPLFEYPHDILRHHQKTLE